MKNNKSLNENIEYIAQIEGEKFVYDKSEIENEYSKKQDDKSSIAIKILSILGGFLSSNAFLGFLAIAGLFDSGVGLVSTGIIFIGAAEWLNRVYNKLILDTISVSSYLIGLCLIAFGLAELKIEENIISIILILISMLIIRITKNFILIFLSALLINSCLIFLIFENHIYDYIHIYNALLLAIITYLFLNEAKLISGNELLSRLYYPIRIGLVISLIIGLIFVGQRGVFDFGLKYNWLSSIITIPLIIYLISIITKIIGVQKIKTLCIIYALSILFILPTALSPAISGSLIIILLCFYVNDKIGLTIGIMSFIYFISQYYYDLNYTLLTKSIILFISGISFLLFYIFTYKKLDNNEKI